MKTMKTILLAFVAAMVMISCSEDPTPPVAGFSVSSDAAVQWDDVTITSTATGADETTYAVTGGAYVMDDATLSIQFLDAATYTITQTATNVDGSTESMMDVVVTAPDNIYNVAGTEMPLTANAFWYDASAMGGTVYIRMIADIAGQTNTNLIKLYPVAGPNPLEATYTFADDGAIGTYDAGMSYNWDGGFSYDWTTSGESGDDLVISLVYEDPNDATKNVYDITLASYTMNYGQWDFQTCFCFISDGTKSLLVSYRGVIDPAS